MVFLQLRVDISFFPHRIIVGLAHILLRTDYSPIIGLVLALTT